MKIAVFAAIALLSGCVTTSEIIPMGKDSYMVSGSGTGGLSYGKTMPAALKAANAYCTKEGKLMIARHTETQGRFNGEAADLLFSCVTADDPEYKRPNMRKDNGVTTIENR